MADAPGTSAMRSRTGSTSGSMSASVSATAGSGGRARTMSASSSFSGGGAASGGGAFAARMELMAQRAAREVAASGDSTGADESSLEQFLQPLRFGDSTRLWDASWQGHLCAVRSGTPYSGLTCTAAPTVSGTTAATTNTATTAASNALLPPTPIAHGGSTFEIRPRLKYRASKTLRKAVRAALPGEDFPTESSAIEVNPHVAALAEAAETEREENMLELRRRHGDTLTYGQMVTLYCTISHRYIQSTTNRTSELEPSNLHVHMVDSPDQNAWFRVLPRFKVRSEGDAVRVNDQIVLESVATPGQYLHSSLARLPATTVLGGLVEVNLSVTRTAYTLRSHRSHSANPDMIAAGSIVQIFHKEITAYLAAEGMVGRTPTNGAHLRVRLPDDSRPNRALPPTSAATFWQIELAEAPLDGRNICWEEPVRLQHVGTQRYLALVNGSSGGGRSSSSSNGGGGGGGGYTVQLLTTPTPACEFILTPVVQESDEMPVGASARIRHRASGLWMHGEDAASTQFLRQPRITLARSSAVGGSEDGVGGPKRGSLSGGRRSSRSGQIAAAAAAATAAARNMGSLPEMGAADNSSLDVKCAAIVWDNAPLTRIQFTKERNFNGTYR